MPLHVGSGRYFPTSLHMLLCMKGASCEEAVISGVVATFVRKRQWLSCTRGWRGSGKESGFGPGKKGHSGASRHGGGWCPPGHRGVYKHYLLGDAARAGSCCCAGGAAWNPHELRD
ncbi:hypothetical protein O3P69_018218 [Scylla paramamosain]|uniref:Uncharacterized protein n=1 Tax=Scylla paramamosain TaxID=85552 RepID=A0AAW0TIK0_SCYPA